jgi:DNA-binding LacI/PurR family transcriptional regulator
MSNTLRDVAREAGLSIAVVGRALGNYGRVSDEARKIALKAARKIGYEPNMVARSLRKKVTHQIGIIIPDIRNPHFTDAVRGVEDTAIEHGYSLMLCNSDENKDKENLYLFELCTRRIDGLILCPTEGTNNKYLTKIIEENFPVVVYDRKMDGIEAPQLVMDNEGGAQQAVNLFVRLGHRRIALVSLNSSISPLRARFEGYKRGLEENGIPFDPELVRHVPLQQEEICQSIQELLNLRKKPTALIVTETLLTTRVLLALKKYEIRIPTRIAIIGFGESRWCSLTNPPLTTVGVPAYSTGKMICETLLRRIKELSKNPRKAKDLCEKIVIPMKLTIRESQGGKLT